MVEVKKRSGVQVVGHSRCSDGYGSFGKREMRGDRGSRKGETGHGRRKTQFFTLFMLSRTSDNTTSQNIGGPMHGRSPTSNFGGPSPPVPPRSPPLRQGMIG